MDNLSIVGKKLDQIPSSVRNPNQAKVNVFDMQALLAFEDKTVGLEQYRDVLEWLVRNKIANELLLPCESNSEHL